jgi:hypothetical protein
MSYRPWDRPVTPASPARDSYISANSHWQRQCLKHGAQSAKARAAEQTMHEAGDAWMLAAQTPATTQSLGAPDDESRENDASPLAESPDA